MSEIFVLFLYEYNKQEREFIFLRSIRQNVSPFMQRSTNSCFKRSVICEFLAKKVNSSGNTYERIYYHPVTGEYIPGGYLYYMNPNAPWSLNFSYSFNYSKSYSYQSTTKELLENKRYTQTLNMSGNVKLTPRMNIQATSGFDVMAMRFTTTQISAT